MITAKGNVTELNGTNIELMQEFANILDHLLEESPEIVLSAFKVYSDDMKAALTACNASALTIAETILKLQKELNK